ncbi:hypothetical protein ACTOB_000474 [Actinoplanes oblitus]|uniref:Uncharacterized protein n=1 Tax=Actinoplanes oblitus TaxID=3040509 RepID=A0ABY8WIU7_9ACTN|nr:hypothetical protein [Actinoplanes oblitus]WIM96991.1 hypothetical protein ACTOB_000474 [Actinoplanes oblitus]
MTASIGIWAQGDPTGESVLYRWEADQQTGFVTFEVPTRKIRPADGNGQSIGDLVFDPAEGEPSGTAVGVNRPLFNQVSSPSCAHIGVPALPVTFLIVPSRGLLGRSVRYDLLPLSYA